MRTLYSLCLALALGALAVAPAASAQQLSPEEAEEQGVAPVTADRPTSQTAVRGGAQVCVDAVLLVPDSGDDAVSTFDAQTGDLIDPIFILDPDNLSTPKNAIPNFGRDGVFVSDQLGDAVFEYDCAGNFVGIFAPAGGVDNAILDNIRGMDYSPDGDELWVTVGGGGNEDTVARFDQSGNYLGNLFPNGANGLVSPFDVLVRDSDVLVSDFLGDPIFRYAFDGTFLGIFQEPSSTLNAPQQLNLADNGNVLAAGFSSPSGAYEFSPTGQQLAVYDAVGSTPRGVYELPNGNILVTTSAGLQEVTRQNVLVRTIDDANQYIELFAAGGGDDFGVSCSGGGAVAQGGTASFSYEVCNNTDSAASGVVFFTASQGGNQVAGPTQVQSGTLAANSCTGTQSFNVRVPANAPTGDYTLTISAGSDAGSAVASCDVDVTVTGSTRPAGAAATWSLLEATAWAPALAAGEAEAAVGVFPNPLRDGATLRYAVEADAEVRLAVYDVLGREVAVLAEGAVEAGSHSAAFDASGLPAGVYVYRLAVGATVETGRMTVVR